MKKLTILFLLFFYLSLNLLIGQEEKKNRWDVNYNIDYNQEAHFPGGDQALYSYIFNNFQYTNEAIEKKISGEVMVSFDILPDSTVSNIIVLSSPGYGTSDEIVRVIKPLKFAPAVLEGKPREQNIVITIPLRAFRRE